MAKIEKLTVKKIDKLTKPGRYGDGSGLYLQVSGPTSRSWILRYEKAGRERWLGLGSQRTFTLKEARERARKARQLLADGVDPLAQKKAAKAAKALADAKAITFEEAARQFYDQHRKKWSVKHAAQFISSLKEYAFKKIGKLAVADVDIGEVLKVLEQKHEDYPDQQLWNAVPVTANRVRNRIEQVLDWATVRGYRTGDNPARWKGHLSNVLPARNNKEVEHLAALPYTEVSEFITALHGRQGTAAAALEFLILTAARTGELIGAQWDEIDFEQKLWIVPASRIKGGRQHRVPLTDRALEILRDPDRCPREPDNPFVFIGPQQGAGLSDEVMTLLLKRMGHDDITVHGFRSTFRDWAGETTSFPSDICEVALAHAVGGKVQISYQRGDLLEKRRKLMEHWAEYCLTPKRDASGVVTPIRGQR
jgi:integrase